MDRSSLGGTTAAPASIVSSSDGVLLVIYAFIGGIGMVGNGLVCLIFTVRRQAFGSVTNLLILNQSMIDLVDSVLFLILRFGPQFSSLSGANGSVWSELVCRLWFSEYIMWSLFIASTVNLLFVTLERYFAICHAVRHRSLFTVRRANIGRGLVWLIGFSYQSYWAVLHRVTADGECYAVWPSLTVQAFLGTVFFCCEYLIPLSIMTFSYISIIVMLRNRSRRTNANTFQRTKRNVTLTLCFVSVSYTVCWTPTEFSYLMYNMGHEYDFSSSTHYIFTVLVLLNMCINPLIYLIKYKRFQVELKKIFFRRCCGYNRVDSLPGPTGTALSVVAVASGGPWGVAPL
ncbi:neuropeptide Y receptor type 6-like [Patiria miniata]|uniref:G-protein coupled receptors family 1 profile domain-containing protein n=1 Tax=Patiria miniata TaxID=46514 RepID=A0A914AX70_PATMI|nr:neuropeptide Y receptor type 6-like [Patiria miniata]